MVWIATPEGTIRVPGLRCGSALVRGERCVYAGVEVRRDHDGTIWVGDQRVDPRARLDYAVSRITGWPVVPHDRRRR